jgi:MYXO-CTERM domain-containing protein
MKKALQTRSPRAAGLALALALGLAAASHSAQAAIFQYTASGGNISGSLNGNPFTDAVWSVTVTANTDYADTPFGGFSEISSSHVSAPLITIGTGQTALTATMLQNFAIGSVDYNFLYTSGGSNNAFVSNQGGISVDDVTTSASFNDLKNIGTYTGTSFFAKTTFNTNLGDLVINSDTNQPGTFQVSAASTAVPEPGAFIPAAVLVAGALLRRRRSRSHRSGRATA